MTSDAVHHLLQFYPLRQFLLVYLPPLFAVDLGDFVAVGTLVKKLGKGGEQAGNGRRYLVAIMVRIMICFMLSLIVISRFRFFRTMLFLRYLNRQVGKGKIFGFLQNHIFYRPELRIVN